MITQLSAPSTLLLRSMLLMHIDASSDNQSPPLSPPRSAEPHLVWVQISDNGDVFAESSRFDNELQGLGDEVASSGNERMACILVAVINSVISALRNSGHGSMRIEAEFHSSDGPLPILTAAIIEKQSVDYNAYMKELARVRRIKFSTTV
jgi:hypothetical protein